MTGAAIVLLFSMLFLLAGAGLLLWRGSKQGAGRAAFDRLEAWSAHYAEAQDPRRLARLGLAQLPFLKRKLQQGGVALTPRSYFIIALAGALLTLLALLLFNATAALLFAAAVYPWLLYMVLLWRVRRFHRAVVAQLPAFLDGMVRAISVGNSVAVALQQTNEKFDGPIKAVFEQVIRRHRLGASIEDALEQVAMAYGINELQLLAAVVAVNMRYGGKIGVVLENMANAIREMDRAQRELMALTGETRLSAYVLSALPFVVGLAITFLNPGYVMSMWNDQTGGRTMLLVAFGLNLVGMTILFRMAKFRG